MRIERVKLHNFRIYKDAELNFSKFDNDMHIVIGRNGMGKTTLLNAINWCFYGEEPHIYENNSLTKANLTELSNNNGNLEVFVEIIVSTSNSTLTFNRTAYYKKEKEFSTKFKCDEKKETGETELHKDEDAQSLVNNIVPEDIKEFFFFDGEQLDTYFVSQKAKNVKHNISIVSRIDLLESLSKRLNIKAKDYRSSAVKLDSNVKGIEEEIEKKENGMRGNIEKKKEIQKDVDFSEGEWNKLDMELSGLPDLEEKDADFKKAEKEVETLNNNRISKQETKYKNLLYSAPSILMKSALDSVSNEITIEEDKGNIPPSIDEEELRKSLDQGNCTACHQDLSKDAIEYINKILTDYKFSSNESKKLSNLNKDLEKHFDIIKEYGFKEKEYNKDLKLIDAQISHFDEEMKEIEKAFVDYDQETIANKFKARKQYKKAMDEGNKKIGELNTLIGLYDKKIEKLNNRLNKSQKAEKETKILLDKRKICEDSKIVVDKTIDQIRDMTKKNIEAFTKETFFNLLWKKKTYSDVRINDDYTLELIHSKYNANSLGTASAAERELLVLAFTLGIHKISGFDASLLIDTPLARVSDKHRVNFSKVLLEISNNKQIILIVTPDEFSDNIKPLFADTPQWKVELNDVEDEAKFVEVG